MKKKYKAILFDNDGTVVDTENAILTSVEYTLKTCLGIENPDLEYFKSLIGLPAIDQFSHYTDNIDKAQEMTNTYRSHNDTVKDELSKNFDGLPQVLQELKNRGYKMGIVTSKRHDICTHGLKLLDLEDIFVYVQGSDDWHVHKPEPGALSYACEQISCDPTEVVYVGDSVFDMKSANGAGCATCAVTWGCGKVEALEAENPAYIVDRPEQLLDLFE